MLPGAGQTPDHSWVEIDSTDLLNVYYDHGVFFRKVIPKTSQMPLRRVFTSHDLIRIHNAVHVEQRQRLDLVHKIKECMRKKERKG